MSSNLTETKAQGQIVGRRVKDVSLFLSDLNEQRVNKQYEKILALFPVMFLIAPLVNFILKGQISAILQFVILIALTSFALLWFKRNEFGKGLIWNSEGIGLSKDNVVINWTPWSKVESIKLSMTKAYIFDQNEKELWNVSITGELKEYFTQTRFQSIGDRTPTFIVSEDLILQEAKSYRQFKKRTMIACIAVFVVLLAIEVSPIHQTSIFKHVSLILLFGLVASFLVPLILAFIRSDSEKFLRNKAKEYFDPFEDVSFDLSAKRGAVELLYKGLLDTKPETRRLSMMCVVFVQSMLIPIIVALLTHRIDIYAAVFIFALCMVAALTVYLLYMKHTKSVIDLLNRDSSLHISKDDNNFFVLKDDKCLEVSEAESCSLILVNFNGTNKYLKLHTDEGVFYFQPDYMRPIFKAE